jgi:hypothetical protein
VNRSQIPFEPNSGKKSSSKKSDPTKSDPKKSDKNQRRSLKKPEVKPSQKPEKLNKERSSVSSGIPPIVSKRLVRRAALFSGIPTSLGFITFIASYIIVVKKWADLPNSAVVLVSMGFLGIGVLGLSYGSISASWDENREGNWWGWQEFKQNFGYLRDAWKAQRAEKLSTQKPD